MITEKYKNIFNQFLASYEKIHVNPWHEISKSEALKLSEKLADSMNVDNDFNFKYFMCNTLKRLSGNDDAHTKINFYCPVPLNFRLFDENVFVDYPKELKFGKLVSISGVDVKTILKEIDDVIIYGTDGERRWQSELALFDLPTLLGLPSLRNCPKISYQIEKDGQIVVKEFDRELKFESEAIEQSRKFQYGDAASYEILENAVVYKHRSLQPRFEEKIKETIENLRGEDLSKIDRIIVDLRGNRGGNSALNKYLMEFLRENPDKKLYCLTDYRIFSGGTYALRDLLSLGAITIGEEIATPINHFGNSHHISIENFNFSISEAYFNPFTKTEVFSKEDFKSLPKEMLAETIFHPDVEIVQTAQDYIAGNDAVLNYVLKTGEKCHERN